MRRGSRRPDVDANRRSPPCRAAGAGAGDNTWGHDADHLMDRVDDCDDALGRAVAAAQQGDEAGFRHIFRVVQPGLLRYLTVLVGADAEDVAGETWAQVCRDLGRFDGGADGFRAWVTTIGRHRALDHLRARKRRMTEPAPVEALHEVPAADDTTSEVIEAMATRDALAWIGSLPRDQAEAVLLRVVIGLDAASAARVLGKRPGAVRTAAYRGLRRLAASVNDDASPYQARPPQPAVIRTGLSTLM
jgi:RNA polymerase sigma-70 factor, ECF subfamily